MSNSTTEKTYESELEAWTCLPRVWVAPGNAAITRNYPQQHQWEWVTSEYRMDGYDICKRCGMRP